MSGWSESFPFSWPPFLFEVAVHEELAEREKVEGYRVAVHAPPPLPRHGFLDLVEISGDIETVVRGGHIREGNAEIEFQLACEGKILFEFVAGVLDVESLLNARALDLERHENERGGAFDPAVLVLEPPEHAEREEQGVYPLLLDEGSGRPLGLQKPRLEFRRGQRSLKLRIHMTRRQAAGGIRLFGLVEMIYEAVRIPILRESIVLRSRFESHGLPLGDEDTEDLFREFVGDLDAAGAGGTVIQKRIAKPEVEQLPPARLYGGADISVGHASSFLTVAREP